MIGNISEEKRLTIEIEILKDQEAGKSSGAALAGRQWKKCTDPGSEGSAETKRAQIHRWKIQKSGNCTEALSRKEKELSERNDRKKV